VYSCSSVIVEESVVRDCRSVERMGVIYKGGKINHSLSDSSGRQGKWGKGGGDRKGASE
jgi:hypothetical protein